MKNLSPFQKRMLVFKIIIVIAFVILFLFLVRTMFIY